MNPHTTPSGLLTPPVVLLCVQEESVLLMAAELGHSMRSTAYKTTPRDAFSYDGPDFDPNANVTYNSTAGDPPGQNVTLNVLEARRKLAQLGREMKQASSAGSRRSHPHLQRPLRGPCNFRPTAIQISRLVCVWAIVAQVDAKLKPLQAELQALVDKEDAWVDEEDRKKEAAAATVAGRAAALFRGLFARARGTGRSATALMSKNITSNSTEARNVTSNSTEAGKGGGAEDDDIDSPWAAQIVALDDRSVGVPSSAAPRPVLSE